MNSDPHGQSDSTPPKCDVQPTFSCNVPEKSQEVTLKRENYVKLLVDARVTDPACWPPGLEEVAAMIERVRDIEEACVEKYGDFDPEKLSAQVQDEYMDLHLVIDAIQENCDIEEIAELMAEASGASTKEVAEPTEPAANPVVPTTDIWPTFPTLQENDNFA